VSGQSIVASSDGKNLDTVFAQGLAKCRADQAGRSRNGHLHDVLSYFKQKDRKDREELPRV
jgi:hypothetical protein